MDTCDWCSQDSDTVTTIDSVKICGYCLEHLSDEQFENLLAGELSAPPIENKEPIVIKKAGTVLEARENFKFGCDPECFIKNTETGEYVSAEGLIPGTKEEPYPVKYGAVQVDGMAAEFNIEPATNFKDFNRNIQAVINQLTKMLPKGYVLDFIPAVDFKPEIFDASPDKAKELGCSPDFNAWTGDVNPPPKDDSNPYRRTASGHIHIGWSENEDLTNDQHLMNCRDLVKQLDWFLGGWSVSVDTDPRRRALYGRAGACRYKTYGVEYRVLSNFWVVSQELRLAVWNRLQIAIDGMAKTFYPDFVPEYLSSMLVEGINNSAIPADLLGSYKYPLITDTVEPVPYGRKLPLRKKPSLPSGGILNQIATPISDLDTSWI